MKPRYLLIAAALLLTGCAGLPRSLRQEIASENDKLEQAKKQLKRTESTIKDDFAKKPDLFKGTRVETEWPARLGVAKSKLDRAEEARRNLDKVRSGDRQSVAKAESLLSDEHRYRQAALDEAAAIEGEANRWLDFQRNLPHYLAKMQKEHDQINTVDIGPVAQVVEKAERDWPAKKSDLDSRLNAIRSAPTRAEQQWQSTASAREDAAAGKATGAEIANLIEADNTLADATTGVSRQADELRALSGQLYDSWDKILEDLEVTNQGRDAIYREKLKTVRTHYTDVAEKKTEISSDVKWVDVSPISYRAVERDLGMAISHKDAGLFDSEAQNIAQPPGYAYIAPPDVGRNQYGYWTHNESGSFWTFLPQYLIMRELLWGRGGYQPVIVNQYNSYANARRAGKSYYGQETPQAPPKFGTHGTFTQQRYASSRYVQSGGYKSSAFSSQPSAPAAAPAPRYSGSPNDPNQGKRFGRTPEEQSQGRRFGSNRDNSPPAGRRFGNGGSSPRSAPRSAPRSFGRRR
ncbi:MAG: hypothetical protein QOJ99_1451 [Bryobacterales bacterium]|nr:hypothetical protein [Bryobacterales bacterium]